MAINTNDDYIRKFAKSIGHDLNDTRIYESNDRQMYVAIPDANSGYTFPALVLDKKYFDTFNDPESYATRYQAAARKVNYVASALSDDPQINYESYLTHEIQHLYDYARHGDSVVTAMSQQSPVTPPVSEYAKTSELESRAERAARNYYESRTLEYTTYLPKDILLK